MISKLSEKSKSGIDFIAQLFQEGVLGYPIDYEMCQPKDDDLSETFGYWFGSDSWASNGDSFVQFGMDGTGSMFCLWYYPDLSGEPPVVFFGSEGERCLIATNINDFIKQMSSGKLLFDGRFSDPDPEEQSELDWSSLRCKAEEYLGPWELDPDEIQKLGVKEHPDFVSWVESKVG